MRGMCVYHFFLFYSCLFPVCGCTYIPQLQSELRLMSSASLDAPLAVICLCAGFLPRNSDPLPPLTQLFKRPWSQTNPLAPTAAFPRHYLLFQTSGKMPEKPALEWYSMARWGWEWRVVAGGFGTRMQAPWASQFEVVATVVASTTDKMASAWFGRLRCRCYYTAGNIGDVCGT